MNEQVKLYEHFKTTPDPRIERGRKHLLEDIIFIAIVSILCGADDWNDARSYRSIS